MSLKRLKTVPSRRGKGEVFPGPSTFGGPCHRSKLPTKVFFNWLLSDIKYPWNLFSGRAPPRTLVGKLTTRPRPLVLVGWWGDTPPKFPSVDAFGVSISAPMDQWCSTRVRQCTRVGLESLLWGPWGLGLEPHDLDMDSKSSGFWLSTVGLWLGINWAIIYYLLFCYSMDMIVLFNFWYSYFRLHEVSCRACVQQWKHVHATSQSSAVKQSSLTWFA